MYILQKRTKYCIYCILYNSENCVN